MSEHRDLADFLRLQANSADFGHDRTRFARAAELLIAAAPAEGVAENNAAALANGVAEDKAAA